MTEHPDREAYSMSPHAERQSSIRGIAPGDVADVVAERLEGRRPRASFAVFCGWAEAGGYRGASNGDEVWAVVRGGLVVTVMFRRGDQPATPAALRVEEVVK